MSPTANLLYLCVPLPALPHVSHHITPPRTHMLSAPAGAPHVLATCPTTLWPPHYLPYHVPHIPTFAASYMARPFHRSITLDAPITHPNPSPHCLHILLGVTSPWVPSCPYHMPSHAPHVLLTSPVTLCLSPSCASSHYEHPHHVLHHLPQHLPSMCPLPSCLYFLFIYLFFFCISFLSKEVTCKSLPKHSHLLSGLRERGSNL